MSRTWSPRHSIVGGIGSILMVRSGPSMARPRRRDVQNTPLVRGLVYISGSSEGVDGGAHAFGDAAGVGVGSRAQQHQQTVAPGLLALLDHVVGADAATDHGDWRHG